MALRYRKHIRLPGHDYLHGAYFVTLCTRYRMQVLGRIVGTDADARMELTDVGRIVDECWRAIPDHFPHARLDEMQIMPDHLHAIIALERGNGTIGATRWVAATNVVDETGHRPNGPRRSSLAAIIGAFKSETTKRVNRMNATMGQRLWQPNFHERTIREYTGERGRIAQYIVENPRNWR
ncbi:MAG: hypothetical protein QM724_06440 [Flavobacteriales bacterium]